MRKLFIRVSIVLFLMTLFLSLVSAQQAQELTKFNGFLFEKLGNIGTRSEGPAYFLQLRDYREIAIKKHALLWKSDQTLDKYLNKNVQIDGYYLTDTTIDYKDIKMWKP